MLLLVFFSLPNSSSIASTGGTPVSARRSRTIRLQFVRVVKQFLLARAGRLDVDGRENAAVHQRAVQMHLHVAGALELFKNDFVHAAAGVHQRRGHDGERAAFLDVARRAEKALRLVQRVGVHAAGQDFAGVRLDGVVGAGEARDGIEQNHHVALVLDHAARLFDDHFGHLHVAFRRLVERGAEITSAPLQVRSMSVTSSGRSSISRMNR